MNLGAILALLRRCWEAGQQGGRLGSRSAASTAAGRLALALVLRPVSHLALAGAVCQRERQEQATRLNLRCHAGNTLPNVAQHHAGQAHNPQPHSHAACLQREQRRRPRARWPQPEQAQLSRGLASSSAVRALSNACLWASASLPACSCTRTAGSMAAAGAAVRCTWANQLWGSSPRSRLMAAGACSAAAITAARSASLIATNGLRPRIRIAWLAVAVQKALR